MVVWLGFVKGTRGPNKYGPDPLAQGNAYIGPGMETVREGESSEVTAENRGCPGNGQKLDGVGNLNPVDSATMKPPEKQRTKFRFGWFILIIGCGIATFVLQYYNHQQNKQINESFDRMFKYRSSPALDKNMSDLLDKITSANKAKLSGMFGVEFGERIPSDAAVLIDGTDGTLLTYFKPESPELTFALYAKAALPKTRVVCIIQGITNFSKEEKGQCFETYEKYKKEASCMSVGRFMQ